MRPFCTRKLTLKPNRYRFSPVVFLVFICVVAAPALAANAPATLQEIVVKGAEYTSLGAMSLGRKTVSSLRPETSDTATLLRDIPGVSLYGAGGVSSLPVIHGLADDRVRTKVDGMDLISSCPNHMNSPLSYIDPSNVGSMEVYTGITPVSVGGDSIGGAIVVDAPEPEFAAPGQGRLLKGEAGTFYRSNGYSYGGNLSATYASESMNLTYTGSTAKANNYKAGGNFKNFFATGRAGHNLPLDEVGSTAYEVWNQGLDFALRSGNHLFEAKAGYQNIPYELYPNQRMDLLGNTQYRVNLRYLGQYDWGALEVRAYHENVRHHMDFGDDKQFFYGSLATILAPGMPMDTEGKTTGALIKADVILSQRDTLRLGAEMQRYRLDDWWSPSPSVLPPGVATGGMAPNTFWNINNGKRDRLDFFAEWEARWNPQWTSQVGVRSDTVMMNTGVVQGYNNTAMYNGSPQFPATTFDARNRRRTDGNFDVSALVRYTPKPVFTIEAGYARKSRSPHIYERYTWSTNTMAMEMNNFVGDGNFYLGNIDLKPEVANTVSITADLHDAAREEWGLKVTPYYTYVSNFIDAMRCPTSVCGNSAAVRASLTAARSFVYLKYVNESARLFGIDLSGYFPIAKTADFGNFTATGVLNYVRGGNRTTGDNLYNIMPLNAKLAVVHRLGKLTSTIEGQFVEAKKQISQVRNEFRTGGYCLLNLRGSYVWKWLRVDAGVENVLDKLYYLPLGGAYVGQGMTMSGNGVPWGIPVPGMGRSLYAAVTVKF